MAVPTRCAAIFSGAGAAEPTLLPKRLPLPLQPVRPGVQRTRLAAVEVEADAVGLRLPRLRLRQVPARGAAAG